MKIHSALFFESSSLKTRFSSKNAKVFGDSRYIHKRYTIYIYIHKHIDKPCNKKHWAQLKSHRKNRLSIVTMQTNDNAAVTGTNIALERFQSIAECDRKPPQRDL